MSEVTKRKAAVIGAGFSGLTIAWALKRSGTEVSLFEAGSRIGGMISSEMISGQLVESAANALIADQNVELLLKEIGLSPIQSGYKSNNRYIFRGKPSRFPFGFFELIRAIFGFLYHLITKKLKPVSQESVSQWAVRIFGKPFDEYAASPALQGIYAASSQELSAELITAPYFNEFLKVPKAKYRGSISFKGGMQELTDQIADWLKKKSVSFHLNSFQNIEDLQQQFDTVILATSLEQAKVLLKKTSVYDSINELNSVSLTAVAVQPKTSRKIRGFGCLFPKNENFKSLGVLFNSDIFEGRGHESAENWILPGQHLDLKSIEHLIRNDRTRLIGEAADFSILKHFVWTKSLPKYDSKLRNFLGSEIFTDADRGVNVDGACLSVNGKKVYLTGNYLGGIGLAKILSYNLRLSQRIVRDLQ